MSYLVCHTENQCLDSTQESEKGTYLLLPAIRLCCVPQPPLVNLYPCCSAMRSLVWLLSTSWREVAGVTLCSIEPRKKWMGWLCLGLMYPLGDKPIMLINKTLKGTQINDRSLYVVTPWVAVVLSTQKNQKIHSQSSVLLSLCGCQ